jgi:ataxia telangiectasia mutated family protein
MGSRALTFSATCRAAAAQLHAILAAGLVQYHEIGEAVDAMITAADIHAPVVLCDSSIFLMMHLLNTRVTEVPGTSVLACQHVIRWIFTKWNPGMKYNKLKDDHY